MLRFEELEIHKVFLRLSNLALTNNLSPSTAVDLIRASVGRTVMKHHSSRLGRKEGIAGLLLVTPQIIYFLVFFLLPLLGIGGLPFV